MLDCRASFCNSSLIGPGIGQQAFSIHSAAARSCGGPCNENSGNTTSFGGFGPHIAPAISSSTWAMLSLMVAHAPARSAALTASLLLVWMQLARQRWMVIRPLFLRYA